MHESGNEKTGRWSRPVTWTSAGLLAVMLVIAVGAVRELPGIELQNSVHTWLAADDPEALVLKWCHDRFPEEDQILISWTGSSLTDPRVGQFADALAGSNDSETGQRSGGLDCVRDVATPHELLERMAELDVDQAEAVARLRGVLIGKADPSNVDARKEADWAPVAILATLAPGDPAAQRQYIQAIRETATKCGIAETDLHLGGETVTSAALDVEVIKAAWNTSDPLQRPPVFLLSAVAGVLLAIGILRSVRLATMVLACACFTSLIGTALVPYCGHSMNMVVIVMPTLLIVLTLSAAIHLANYWRRAVASGAEHPIREAIRMGWLPCLLAAVTTGIGLISLSISPLGPIRDFGLFSATGTLLSFPVVLLGLTAMMTVWPVSPPDANRTNHRGWTRLGNALTRRRRLVASLSLLLFAVASTGLCWSRTEVKVARYFPDGSQLADDYAFLERELGGTVPVEVLISFDEEAVTRLPFLERVEAVREIEHQLKEHPEISGAVSLADFLQESEPPGADAGFMLRTRYVARSRVTESRVRDDAATPTFLYSQMSEPADPPVNPDADADEFQTPGQVWRIRAQAYVTTDADYGELTNELRTIVKKALAGRQGMEQRVTGTVPVFFRAQQELLRSLIRGFWLAFSVIAVAMMFLLKSVRSGLLSMLPAMMPVGLVFGLMSWRGTPLDIGTMLTASVALGISVDGTLHLLTWFRDALRTGHSLDEATAIALQHCGPAMLQTSAVIGLSLLMYYPAELLLISRFGWVMAALLTAAFVAEVIFLPSLLAGVLGRSIQCTNDSVRSRRPSHSSSGEAPEEIQPDSPESPLIPFPAARGTSEGSKAA
ncbi:MAG: efflux RND transporter permease subunit [Planctomycetota bacterium]